MASAGKGNRMGTPLPHRTGTGDTERPEQKAFTAPAGIDNPVRTEKTAPCAVFALVPTRRVGTRGNDGVSQPWVRQKLYLCPTLRH